MLIERYSNQGFEPQLQTGHLLEDIKYYKMSWEEILIEYYPDRDPEIPWLKGAERRYYEKRDFYIENERYLRCGVWAFPNCNVDELYLNHLKKLPKRNIAVIPDDAICFLPNELMKKKAIEFVHYPEMFIPAQSLVDIEIIE